MRWWLSKATSSVRPVEDADLQDGGSIDEAVRTDELLLGKEDSPGGEVVFGAGGDKYWERLSLGDNRIVGKLRHVKEAGSPPWTLEVEFSAPIFNAR